MKLFMLMKSPAPSNDNTFTPNNDQMTPNYQFHFTATRFHCIIEAHYF